MSQCFRNNTSHRVRIEAHLLSGDVRHDILRQVAPGATTTTPWLPTHGLRGVKFWRVTQAGRDHRPIAELRQWHGRQVEIIDPNYRLSKSDGQCLTLESNPNFVRGFPQNPAYVNQLFVRDDGRTEIIPATRNIARRALAPMLGLTASIS